MGARKKFCPFPKKKEKFTESVGLSNILDGEQGRSAVV